jgi:hypothetical protein
MKQCITHLRLLTLECFNSLYMLMQHKLMWVNASKSCSSQQLLHFNTYGHDNANLRKLSNAVGILVW